MDLNYTYLPLNLGRASTPKTPNEEIENAIKNIAQISTRLRTTNKLEDVINVIGELQMARVNLNNLAIKYKKTN
jgi:hypothetical protein